MHHILSNKGSPKTALLYYHNQGQTTHIFASNINRLVKGTVKALNLGKQDFTLTLVGSHSLQAGGAMALKHSGADRDTICKQGQWSLDTFLQYIHLQIAAFSAGLTT